VGLDAAAVRPLVAAACAGTTGVDVPGLGECRLAVVALDVDEEATRLLVARAGGEDFVPEEMLLLRGMAWVLHLALRPLRMLATLHERQRMLELVDRGARAAMAARARENGTVVGSLVLVSFHTGASRSGSSGGGSSGGGSSGGSSGGGFSGGGSSGGGQPFTDGQEQTLLT